MSRKRPIGGSGNAGAAEAPEQGVKMEREVVVAAAEVSLDLDVVDGVVLPQLEPEVLSDDVDNKDEDGKRRYKRQILMELYVGIHNERIRT
ncbi:E3 ubiquitin-protein ligase [Hordeum vulgare]|nr:E3 ubiquitin-protein ligase [Hordeum vulgare]